MNWSYVKSSSDLASTGHKKTGPERNEKTEKRYELAALNFPRRERCRGLSLSVSKRVVPTIQVATRTEARTSSSQIRVIRSPSHASCALSYDEYPVSTHYVSA